MSDILFNPSSLPIAKSLHALLGKTLAARQAQDETLATSQSVVMNFRDSSYNAEDGGFHPVEIALGQSGDDRWNIEYIEIYQLWESNFLAYADMGAYDQVCVAPQ